MTLFDTSPHYGNGLSEQRFGAALRRFPRDSFVLSTKVGRRMNPMMPGGSVGGSQVNRSGILDEYPNLSAYVARGEARPAYKRAFDDQLAVFTGKPPTD
jgi:aryl-alcohol dehydrogenase-like predicted oxidoreductase